MKEYDVNDGQYYSGMNNIFNLKGESDQIVDKEQPSVYHPITDECTIECE